MSSGVWLLPLHLISSFLTSPNYWNSAHLQHISTLKPVKKGLLPHYWHRLKNSHWWTGTVIREKKRYIWTEGPSIKYIHSNGGREGVEAKAQTYCFYDVNLLFKSVQGGGGVGGQVSENHQIWAYVLYGWSLNFLSLYAGCPIEGRRDWGRSRPQPTRKIGLSHDPTGLTQKRWFCNCTPTSRCYFWDFVPSLRKRGYGGGGESFNYVFGVIGQLFLPTKSILVENLLANIQK